MTISIKHKFVNPKSDTGDTTVSRASNWNDEHDITLAQNRVLGRVSAANGPVEELTGEQIRTISDTTQAGVLVGINTRTASYTLVASDRGKIVEMNVASANTVTIPNETGIGGVNYPIGTQIKIAQLGTGQSTLLPAAGVTVRSVTGGLSTSTRYGALILYKRASNDWFVIDQTSAYLDGRVDSLETIAGGIANVNTVATNIANVNTVATNIAAVQTVAANVTDVSNFADLYYGPSASNPTTRKDSSALQTGDLYFNTVDKEIRVWGGSSWQSGAAAAISVQQFSGNGSTTAFTLSLSTSSENNTQVYVSGVYRQKDAYSVSGTTLTFAAAPASGTNNIEVVTINSLALGEINASLANVTDAGGYYAGTNVESVLQELGGLVNPTTSKVTAKRFEGIATDDAGTPDAIFRVNRTHTAATAPHSFRDQTAFNPVSSNIAAASFDAALVSGGSQDINHTIGFQARNEHNGSGTLTDMFGYGFYPKVSAGTVTNCIGIDINGFSGAGSVTNYYGLYVRNITNTVSGQKYAIYVAGNLAKSVIGSSTQFVGEGIVSVGNAAKIFLGDGGNGYKSIAYNHNMNANTYDTTDKIQSMYFGGSDITFRWAASGTAGATPSFTNLINIKTDAATNPGALYPAANGTQKLGISGLGWSEVFASNGTINTSDARVKTDVRDLTEAELAAAKQLAREIGVFKFLNAIAKKGDEARSHIGMTVQRVIEIMQSHGLDAMAYGFVCYDQWEDEFEDHHAIYERVIVEPEQVEETPAHVVDVRETVVINGEAVETVRQVEVPAQRRVIKDAVIGDGPVKQEAWREHKVVAGDSYGFRTDQLLLFISRGFEARLSALEAI
jgi:hypothetical protein